MDKNSSNPRWHRMGLQKFNPPITAEKVSYLVQIQWAQLKCENVCIFFVILKLFEKRKTNLWRPEVDIENNDRDWYAVDNFAYLVFL